ncbi:MAG: DUF4349 domain-containing protein [Spirosomataceae bacterium]
MKKLTLSFAFITLTMSIFSCTQTQENAAYIHQQSADSTQAIVTEPNSTTTVPKANLQDRKFIRSADLKFETKDVRQTTYLIEDVTTRYGGFITQNQLRSDIISKETKPISADSLVEITTFNVENSLSLRVPNRNLDSLVRMLNKNIQFLDYRNVSTEDVNLTMLSNSMKINRLENFDKRKQQINDEKNGKILEANIAEDNRLEHQIESDNYKINNLSLSDRVNYSTVNITIYQRTQTQKAFMVNPTVIEPYKPNVFLRLWDSFKDGWVAAEELIVFLMKFWMLIAIGLGIFALHRLSKTKSKTV